MKSKENATNSSECVTCYDQYLVKDFGKKSSEAKKLKKRLTTFYEKYNKPKVRPLEIFIAAAP